jgi:hypothetical protein
MSEFFYPKLQSVNALEPYRLCTVWSTGEVLEVDLAHVMRGAAFAEIRKPDVFSTVHTDGSSIEWFDTELGPDNVYAWAKEQSDEVSHEMLVLGCTATSCRFPVLPMRWASVVAW